METFEVRSKSFTIKWVNAPDASVIRWEFKPLRHSINMGIYRHIKFESSTDLTSVTHSANGANASTGNGSQLSLGQHADLSVDEVNKVPRKLFTLMHQSFFNSDDESLSSRSNSVATSGRGANANGLGADSVNGNSARRRPRTMSSASSLMRLRNRSAASSSFGSSALDDKIDRHLIREQWVGRCDPDEFVSDAFHVEEGGLYAFVFDNTFSKTKAKKVMFSHWLEDQDGVPINLVNSRKTGDSFSSSARLSVSGSPDPAAAGYAFTDAAHGATTSSANTSNGAVAATSTVSAAPTDIMITPAAATNITTADGDTSTQSADTLQVDTSTAPTTAATVPSSAESKSKDVPATHQKKQHKKSKQKHQKEEEQQQKQQQQPQQLGSRLAGPSVYPVDSVAKRFSSFQTSEEKQLGKNTYVIRLKGVVYLQGILRKKRRRAGGNFVKRFFNLNFKYAVLDYYADETANNIRGDMLVTQTIISADPKQLMFYLDSGMEQWILKALSEDDFNVWVQAFNYLKHRDKVQRTIGQPDQHVVAATSILSPPGSPIISPQPSVNGENDYPDALSAQSFRGGLGRPLLDIEESITQLQTQADALAADAKATKSDKSVTEGIEQIRKGLTDLHTEYSGFVNGGVGAAAAESLRSPSRRPLSRTNTAGDASIFSQDFFDAEEVIEEMNDEVQMVGEEECSKDAPCQTNIFEEHLGNASSTSLSSDEEDSSEVEQSKSAMHLDVLPEEVDAATPRDLYPLPWNSPLKYRKDVPPAACDPPSMIAIFRKSIGKDLSSMTMPITCNEPLSFMQKYAESYEYASLLTSAVNSPKETGERLVRIAAFAISYLSSYRMKQRSLRKPFNPFLGETYEMVRPEMGLRFVAEKVIHHPVVFAARIETDDWWIDHSFAPNQKFYGKTAEVILDGKVILHTKDGEIYEWTQPTTVLKNVISLTGEKYTEPAASMVVKSSTGGKATVTFIPDHSRFSSKRSEKLTIKVTADNGKRLAKSASGTWTESLKFDDTDTVFWSVGPLVPDTNEKYGFTEFAAGLNATTAIDKGAAPTDSRFRPDQKMYENGEIDEAESLKHQLEQDQRDRRKDANGNAVTHTPAFFRQGPAGQLDWRMIEGKMSYWERRRRQDWDGLVNLW